jgi:hypothetical protein
MSTIYHTYKQQVWQPQLNVELRNNAEVYVDGKPVTTPTESALANIIMRLHAYTLIKDPPEYLFHDKKNGIV